MEKQSKIQLAPENIPMVEVGAAKSQNLVFCILFRSKNLFLRTNYI